MLHIGVDGLGPTIPVKGQDQAANEAERAADNGEGELTSQLGLPEKVLDIPGIVEVAHTADTLDFADSTRVLGRLTMQPRW